jgi:diguanylate cyclase (GGDEF)-like protein
MGNLSLRAKLYILATILSGIAATVWLFSDWNWLSGWVVILACLAAIGQIFKVEGKTQRTSYNLAWLIYGFAFFLLGPAAALLVILFAHLVEWAWYKYPWYIQSFNMGAYALAILVGGIVYQQLNPKLEQLSIPGVFGVMAALVLFTFVNHFLVGIVIWLARGQNLLQSGVFGILTFSIDYTLVSLGSATAILWIVTPAAALFAAVPLYVLYSSLRVPALERQTDTDPKTGLFNARFFKGALEREFNRAERFDRPLTVAMGDMDMLRNINNNYGHLAGDAVIIGFAKILEESFRGYDVISRFGGEEFIIMMPETTPEEAYLRIEEVRVALETAEFKVSTSREPIKATMSFGIACLSGFNSTPEQIINQADLACYQAKQMGRNQTCLYSTIEEGVYVKN